MSRSNLQPVPGGSGAPAQNGGQHWRGAVAAMDEQPKLRAVPKAGAVQPDLGVVGDIATLDGVVERITFRNEENGYTIAKLKAPRQKQPVTVSGNLPAVHVGESVRLDGKWVNHPQYGRQFQVTQFQVIMPGNIPGLKKYLGSGILKGVGPVWAEHLVNAFGFDTLDVLERSPEKLMTIPGMSQARAQAICEAWREQRAMKDVLAFLQAQGLPVSLALRIVKHYGDAAATIVQQQPYRLTEEVFGVAFELADSMAQRLGLPMNAPQRIMAGIKHVLGQASDQGHTCAERAATIEAAAALLQQDEEQVEQTLTAMAAQEQVFIEEHDGRQLVFPAGLYRAELSVSGAIKDLQNSPTDLLEIFQRGNWPKIFDYLRSLDAQLGLLSERQQEAVRLALTQRVTILTGGPGTGKTTTLRAVIKLLLARGKRVVLAAPTGRAARRLTEATGAQARTIHRLLDLRPVPGVEYQRTAMLEADMVIIDEASMMDLMLAEALLLAVPPGAHLLLVGDPDQLPSVGAGDVLHDLISSEAVPAVRLETIFRQGENSGIVANAHLINAGEQPRLKGFKDFFYLPATKPEECADLVVDLACRRLPAHYKFDAIEDIQVIAPMYSGPAGVDVLNTRLQECLNPPSPAKNERRFGERVFREGDKVMQVVNDYDRQVFNGDIGRIIAISIEEQSVQVQFDNEWNAAYSFSELDELNHAYALSVHKSQGSEYPVVIMPLMRQHHRMLQRNLVYTGISRARQLVVVVGEADALHRAVRNNTAGHRMTGLRRRLAPTS